MDGAIEKNYDGWECEFQSGEPIIDLYTHVKVQGKSQKSNIISTIKLKTIKEGGGTILVANFLTEFLNL